MKTKDNNNLKVNSHIATLKLRDTSLTASYRKDTFLLGSPNRMLQNAGGIG
jgi:hypothetical protein